MLDWEITEWWIFKAFFFNFSNCKKKKGETCHNLSLQFQNLYFVAIHWFLFLLQTLYNIKHISETSSPLNKCEMLTWDYAIKASILIQNILKKLQGKPITVLRNKEELIPLPITNLPFDSYYLGSFLLLSFNSFLLRI